MKKLFLSSAFALIFLSASATFAQAAAPAPAAPAALPTCDGTVTVVRVSDIKPGKTADFLAATAAQLAWYRTNGITDNQIYAARVMVKDASGQWLYSDTQFMTFHINPPRGNTKLPRGDDAYKAFVKMFRDSSDIQTEYTTCTPKASM